MSLINKVAAIIDSKQSIDEVTYLENEISYDAGASMLDIDFTKIIPPPPKNSSLITKKELISIAKVTKSRSREELDLIVEVDKDPLNLFYKYLNPRDLKFPKSKFLDYFNILEQFQYALKYYYNRARPEQVAPYYGLEINVLRTKTHHTPAYRRVHVLYS